MAGKPQNRRELRRQYDAAEPLDPMEEEADDIIEDIDDDDVSERRPKKKPKAAKPKAKATKAAKPAARMRIVWQVMNDAFKPVATFEYSQREAAEAKAKELTEKKDATHFVHKVKEPMPDDAPGLGAVIPRPIVTETPVAAKIAASAAIEDDEEVDDEDEAEVDFDDEDDDDE